MFTTTSITAVSVSMRKDQGDRELAGNEPIRNRHDFGMLLPAEADREEGDP